MGKTYVTFGTIALRCDRNPRHRTLVVAPSVELAAKWERDLLDFGEKRSVVKRGLAARLMPRLATTTGALVATRGPGVVITTLGAVVGGLARTPEWERAWLFEATLHRSGRREQTRRRLARVYGVAAHQRRSAREAKMFGYDFEQAHVISRRHLGGILLEDRPARRDEFDTALRAARRDLIRKRLPRFDLLVLDEAHKLKNASSKRFMYLEQILIGRFDAMLFLTATPFQIDLDELAAVFHLLGHARGAGADDLKATTSSVIQLARRYRERFEALERAWRLCPDEQACIAMDDVALEPHEQLVRSAFASAMDARDALARELAQVMLRERRHTGHRHERIGSLRQDVDDRQAERRGVEVQGAGRVVFAASVRLFHEMRRNDRPTFDPVVLQSLTSSYDAYRSSPVRRRATRGREPFLAGVIDELSSRAQHPKVAEVVEGAVRAAGQGEKTLIFTERIETAKRLARDVTEQLSLDAERGEQRLVVDGSKRLGLLVDEFANRRSPLSLAWRDNLLHTFFPIVVDASQLRRLTRARELRPVVAEALRDSAQGVAANTARKRDVVAAATAVERHILERADMKEDDRAHGLSLLWHADSGSGTGADAEGAGDLPDFDAEDARRLLLGTRGFWAYAVDARSLASLDADLRHRLVLAVRGALTREDAETRRSVLSAIARRRGADRTAALDRAMRSNSWQPIRLRATRFLDLVLAHETQQLRRQWIEAVESTRGTVARLTGEEGHAERTQRGRAFNTPFRPFVVVASSVSQEGLDLQRECSSVIHHDLSWNPASLEQRVGRVDRIHSRTARLRATGELTKLEVGVPIIRGTIDERMWRVVRNRRSWFDLCLGLEHDWASGTLDDTTPPLPERLAQRLRVDLSLAAAR
jgi:superfamily II DNA or RNA helicase